MATNNLNKLSEENYKLPFNRYINYKDGNNYTIKSHKEIVEKILSRLYVQDLEKIINQSREINDTEDRIEYIKSTLSDIREIVRIRGTKGNNNLESLYITLAISDKEFPLHLTGNNDSTYGSIVESNKRTLSRLVMNDGELFKTGGRNYFNSIRSTSSVLTDLNKLNLDISNMFRKSFKSECHFGTLKFKVQNTFYITIPFHRQNHDNDKLTINLERIIFHLDKEGVRTTRRASHNKFTKDSLIRSPFSLSNRGTELKYLNPNNPLNNRKIITLPNLYSGTSNVCWGRNNPLRNFELNSVTDSTQIIYKFFNGNFNADIRINELLLGELENFLNSSLGNFKEQQLMQIVPNHLKDFEGDIINILVKFLKLIENMKVGINSYYSSIGFNELINANVPSNHTNDLQVLRYFENLFEGNYEHVTISSYFILFISTITNTPVDMLYKDMEQKVSDIQYIRELNK